MPDAPATPSSAASSAPTLLRQGATSRSAKTSASSPASTDRAAAAPRFVVYLRVSTDRQGATGLGMEAQRSAVDQHVRRCGATILAEYLEVESGRRSDRPELRRALDHARSARATLLIAKLDRLSRDAHFLTGLRDEGIDFVACDMPDANRLTITILAAVAEHEREMISARTKAALAERKKAYKAEADRLMAERKPLVRRTKAGGVVPLRLGNPNGTAALAGRGNAEAVSAVKARADARARQLEGAVRSIQSAGVTSARGIASALNAQGFPTARDRRWDAKAVTRLLARFA